MLHFNFILLFLFPPLSRGCAATSGTTVTTTTDSSSLTTTVDTTVSTTTASSTSSTTSVSTTSTSTTTSTTTTSVNCVCPPNLGPATTTTPGTIPGQPPVITYMTDANGCSVPSVTCITQNMARFMITIALQENEGFLYNGGCVMTTLPPGIIVCVNGVWTSATTGNQNPKIVCAEMDPAITPTMC